MNVLFLTQTFPRFPADTSGPFIRDLARGLVEGGDSVTVLTPHSEGVDERWDVGGVEVRSFRYAPTRHEVLGYSRSLNADEKIRVRAGIVTPLYLVAARRAASAALREQPFDLLQAHWVVPNALAAAGLSKRVPLAVGLHGSDVFMAEKAAVRSWVSRALRKVSVLTGCSPELVDRVCSLGFDAERSRVIPYGVDTEIFSPDPARRSLWRERLAIPEEAVVAVSVGRMVTKKGYQELLPLLPQLMERNPSLHIVLGGTGDRLEEFQKAAAPWGDRVHFPGVVMRDTLPDLYRAADLFVLPAVHDGQGNVDGLPNVILEAMASGLPVIATSISGIPLAVTEGSNGRLVPEKDRPALSAALSELANDHDLRTSMGEASRRRAETDLTWPAVAARYREAYELALESRWENDGD